jgi:putative membrane-bound dehydrogenase-like protein
MLEMTLFAAEPDVVDPVALTFDAAGRMYVVEMRDYPLGVDGKPGGTVRLLEDLDADGRADRSTLFAEGLSYPTSIAPRAGGVVVTEPPRITYLEDRDGDGRADVREVWFEGFELGVTDSNVNGLRWGLDNYLHGLNGGNGGVVRVPGTPDGVDLRGRDFRIDPETRSIEPTFHTTGGFGLIYDEWGRSFSPYNIDHLQQRMLPVRYLERAPGLPPLRATENISVHGAMARIYPIAAPETRPNHPEQSGHFSAAGGMGFLDFEGRGLPRGVLVADVVGHVVSREVLEQHGPVYRSRRAPEESAREFFASRDPSFRPIGVEMGPDGALYLIDMQRRVIEHPDYIPSSMLRALDLRDGADRGRIYRVVPRSGLAGPRPSLAAADTELLVDELSSPSRWRRATAQRLLVESAEVPVERLRELAVTGDSALGRLHALWVLEGVNGLDLDSLRAALDDVTPEVRENALRLAERRLPGAPALVERVLGMAADPSAAVRFQLALSLGEVEAAGKRAALLDILLADRDHRWSRTAVLSSLGGLAPSVLESLVATAGVEPGLEHALRETADLVAGGLATGEPEPGLDGVLAAVVAADDGEVALAVFEGLESGVARSGWRLPPESRLGELIARAAPHDLSALSLGARRLARRLGLTGSARDRQLTALAAFTAATSEAALGERVRAAQLLALSDDPESARVLLSLLEGAEPAALQLAALEGLADLGADDLGEELMSRWRLLAPSARPPVLRVLLREPAYHSALLGALEGGMVELGELNLDLEQRRRLLRWSTAEIGRRAAALFDDADYGRREQIVDEWLAELPASGSAERGRLIYEDLCARCHSTSGEQMLVGPAIASLRHRGVEDLLTNILDPDVAINPAYTSYRAEMRGGRVEVGLMLAESADAVTLALAGGEQVVMPRSALLSFESTGQSLMPKGLEQGRSAQDLRDLIAFIQDR